MLQRNLLYAGVTRGKRLVVLVGEKAAAIAIRNVSGRRHWSKLSEWRLIDASRSLNSHPDRRHSRSVLSLAIEQLTFAMRMRRGHMTRKRDRALRLPMD
jgi:hypothetical protein